MAKKHTPRFLAICEDAKTRIPEITVDQVMDMVESRADVTLVDVREESEWAAGRIRGAIHLGKGVIERDIEQTVSDVNTVLVLYCGGGYRSALAAVSLQAMGYTHVKSLQGGYKAWVAAGFDISHETA